jgi:hypothetical protein
MIARAIEPETQLALEFIDTIENPRAPWADRFDAWARERGLPPAQARLVKLTVVRIRTFGLVAPRSRR